ncbi:MAG: dihydrofolate reductase [Candidatus Peribacteria bacterium]|jgi:dihydrofolate reductase|nr:dihydrofolate reductase [Candidatus Peribacteria bacterium]
MERKICIIVAIDEEYGIGKNGGLLCHLPNELRRFKGITTGHTVIMGRKTWDSLPPKVRPLPNRRNIVISRNKDLKLEGAEVAHSVEESLKLTEQDEKVFFIGGASIYEEALQYADMVCLTEIRHTFEGVDTFFPKVDWYSEWRQTKLKQITADEKNCYDCVFRIYERKTLKGTTRAKALQLGWKPKWGWWMRLDRTAHSFFIDRIGSTMGCFPLISKIELGDDNTGKIIICGNRNDLKKFWKAMKRQEEVKVYRILLLVNAEKNQCVSAENDKNIAENLHYIDQLPGSENLTEIATFASEPSDEKNPKNVLFPEDDKWTY